MVFTPTLRSSVKKTKIWSDGSSLAAVKKLSWFRLRTKEEWAQSVFATTNERKPNVLDGTHLISVQLPKLCEVHLDFLVRDLESLVDKNKRSQVESQSNETYYRVLTLSLTSSWIVRLTCHSLADSSSAIVDRRRDL